MLLRSPGIYVIVCQPTGKRYVGSALDMYRRWHARHLPQLRRQKHRNRYLQRAWDKYGEDAFTCEMIEAVAADDLIVREQHWIDHHRSADCRYGFNLAPVAGSTRGYGHNAETRKKIGESHTKRYIVRDPQSRERCIKNLYQFCQRRGLCHTSMSRVAVGKITNHQGWECRFEGVTRADWQRSLQRAAVPQVQRRGRKRCSKCGNYKPPAAFSKDKQTKTGLAAYCRDCKSQVQRDNYAQNTEQQKQAVAAYRDADRAAYNACARERYHQKKAQAS